MRQIDEEYIQQGLVRFGYRHFAILGPASELAAEASECAADQDAFWEYHNALYDPQGSGFGSERLKQLAAELGLDTTSFVECLDSRKYGSLVVAERDMVQSLGARGTPAFLINGRPLAGAQPFDVFKEFIEAAIHTGDE